MKKNFDSSSYWEQRYANNGTSGGGSQGRLAAFKASVINQTIKEFNISTINDYGVGDGNQLAPIKGFSHYCGIDVSPTALDMCRKRFTDPQYQFQGYWEPDPEPADMSISLDVLYHLVEDDVLHEYLRRLFRSPIVLIYTMNFEDTGRFAEHVRPRKFTSIIAQRHPEYTLTKTIAQKHKGTDRNSSLAEFFLYQRK